MLEAAFVSLSDAKDRSCATATAAAHASAGFVFVSAAADVVRTSAASSCSPAPSTVVAAAATAAAANSAQEYVVEDAIKTLSKAAELSSLWRSSAPPPSERTSSSSSCLDEALAATASTARSIDSSFFCVPWLESVGPERFAAASAILRAALKDSLVPAAAAALLQRRLLSLSPLRPSLARLGDTVEALTSLGVRAAVAVRGGGGRAASGGGSSSPKAASSPSVSYPLPMRSFALINVAVLGATKLLSAVAEEEEGGGENRSESESDGHSDRSVIRSAVSRALAALAGPTAASAADLVLARGEASKLTPVRFWAQHVLKLASGHHQGCVSGGAGDKEANDAGERFAGALAALAGAEAELSLSSLSSDSSSASASTLAAAKGVISKAAAAVASCWADCAKGKSAGADAAAGAAAASSALAALLKSSDDDHENENERDDARASALVLLLQASLSTKDSTFSSKLITQILPELSRRVSRGGRALLDVAWRDGAASAAAEALAGCTFAAAVDSSSSSSSPVSSSSSLWPSAERALFEAALESPTPAARELVGEAWAGMFRRLLLLKKKAAASSAPGSASLQNNAVASMLATHASALATAAAGAAALSVSSSLPLDSDPPPSPPGRADAEALSEHLSLLAARVLSASASASAGAPLRLACGLLEESEDMLGVAQGRPEASAAASAAVKVAVAVAAGFSSDENSNDDGGGGGGGCGGGGGGGGGENNSGAAADVEKGKRDLWSAANDLLLRASGNLLSADQRWYEEDLPGTMLLVEALCAGCSASFDEGGFDGGGGGIAAESAEDDDNEETFAEPPRVGPLGLYREVVQKTAAIVVSSGHFFGGAPCAGRMLKGGQDGGVVEDADPLLLQQGALCSAGLRALVSTGLPPLASRRSSSSCREGRKSVNDENHLAPAAQPFPELLLPASLAAWALIDPGAAAAASALAPMVARERQGGNTGKHGGVDALYRALLSRAAGLPSVASYPFPASSPFAVRSPAAAAAAAAAAADPCFVALHTAAASLVAHARAGGDDVRSCVPEEMLPEKERGRASTAASTSASAAATMSPFLEVVKAIMKREAPGSNAPSSCSSSSPAAARDAAVLSAALRGAASRVSSRAAARAAAEIDGKVRQALASLREVDAVAEVIDGGGAGGRAGIGGCSSVSAAAAALEEVTAAAQRLKRRCV